MQLHLKEKLKFYTYGIKQPIFKRNTTKLRNKQLCYQNFNTYIVCETLYIFNNLTNNLTSFLHAI